MRRLYYQIKVRIATLKNIYLNSFVVFLPVVIVSK